MWYEEKDGLWKYTTQKPEPLSLSGMEAHLNQQWAFIREIMQPAIAKKLEAHSVALKDMARVVFHGSERVALGESPEDVIAEPSAEEYLKELLFEREALTPQALLEQFIRRVEGRMQLLEQDSKEVKELKGQVHALVSIYEEELKSRRAPPGPKAPVEKKVPVEQRIPPHLRKKMAKEAAKKVEAKEAPVGPPPSEPAKETPPVTSSVPATIPPAAPPTSASTPAQKKKSNRNKRWKK